MVPLPSTAGRANSGARSPGETEEGASVVAVIQNLHPPPVSRETAEPGARPALKPPGGRPPWRLPGKVSPSVHPPPPGKTDEIRPNKETENDAPPTPPPP